MTGNYYVDLLIFAVLGYAYIGFIVWCADKAEKKFCKKVNKEVK